MGRRVDWAKIAKMVQKINEHNLSYREGAKRFGIKLRTLYEYNKRIKKEFKSSCSKQEEAAEKEIEASNKEEKILVSIGSLLPEEIKEIILKYRREHPDHGYKRIEDHLKSRYFVVVSRKKIREALKAHGLEKTCDSSFDRELTSQKGIRRFEADYPRDLYQMDITYVYLTGIAVLYLVVIIDDYSRFCVGAELRHDQRGATMIDVLHRVISRYGKPGKLLTDQGSSFYTWSHESTLFQKYLDDMRIEHLVADPHSPQTLGKVERLNQTIQREVLQKVRFKSFPEAKRGIEDYIHSYNYDRPHQGINGACPCDRFHGIIGEVDRIESCLVCQSVDFSKGYLIFKTAEHTISIVNSSNSLQIFMDGNLLQRKGE
jgi:transposase InsO family protein